MDVGLKKKKSTKRKNQREQLNLSVLFVGSFFAQIPVVNDDLPARIISGRVQVKPNVKEFCGSSVVFVDGSVVEKVKSHK